MIDLGVKNQYIYHSEKRYIIGLIRPKKSEMCLTKILIGAEKTKHAYMRYTHIKCVYRAWSPNMIL